MNHANLDFAGERSNAFLLKISGPRERFELRIRSSSFGSLADWVLMQNEDGSYKDRQIQHRWEDWQACESVSKATIADLQSKLCVALSKNIGSCYGTVDIQAATQSLAHLRQGLDRMTETLHSARVSEGVISSAATEELPE
jgi:hypothetical protein